MSFLASNGLRFTTALSPEQQTQAEVFLEDNCISNEPGRPGCPAGGKATTLASIAAMRHPKWMAAYEESTGDLKLVGVFGMHQLPGNHLEWVGWAVDPEYDTDTTFAAGVYALFTLISWPGCCDSKGHLVTACDTDFFFEILGEGNYTVEDYTVMIPEAITIANEGISFKNVYFTCTEANVQRALNLA